MLTAEQARIESDKVKQAELDRELLGIETAVNKAVGRGEKKVSVFGVMTASMKMKLSELGYTVTQESYVDMRDPRDNHTCTISWA